MVDPARTPPDPRPREHDTAWARTRLAGRIRSAILDLALRPVVRSEIDLGVVGLEHLRAEDGPFILASNHTSHLDATIILVTLPKDVRARTAVGAAKDYFFDVWWRKTFVSLVYAAFPVERGGGERATELARHLLRSGWSIVVFPEGSRSADGWMQRFRHGASRLALETGAAIVPIAIVGAYAAMPRGRWWPRPGRPPVRIRYGEPIRPLPGEAHQDLSFRAQRAIAAMLDEDVPAWVEALPARHRAWALEPKGPELPRWTDAGPEPAGGGRGDAGS